MLKVRVRPLRHSPALLPRQPVPRETRPRLTTHDPSSMQARRKLVTDSAMNKYDQNGQGCKVSTHVCGVQGGGSAQSSAAGCPASEREAQEPWTLLRLRKRGLGPSLGVSWRGFPQLTCLSARQRAPSGPFRSGGRKASIQAGRRGGSTVSCRTSAISWPAQSPNCQTFRRTTTGSHIN